MIETENEHESTGYWPSVTDLFMTLFIVAFAMMAAVFFMLIPKNNISSAKPIIEAVGVDMQNIREPLNRLREKLGLEELRPAQPPDFVISALSQTVDAAISRIEEHEMTIESLRKRIEELTKDDRTRMMADLQQQIAALELENKKLQEENQALHQQIEKLTHNNVEDLLAELDTLRKQLHDKPPIIRIDEQREEYRFESGSSIIGPSFAEGLRQNEFPRLASEIVGRQEEGRVKVDTLEIIGHTDGAPLSGGGNLDEELPEFLVAASPNMRRLQAGSNNDLGLLRALAVKAQWEMFVSGHQSKEILSSLRIRCYSAGQTIPPEGTQAWNEETFRKGDPRARRIEMRLTRLGTS